MKLFTKASIGKMTLKNRVVMAPMGIKSEPDGGFSTRGIRYFEERARGGAGMIITGRVATQDKYEMRSHHLLTGYHHINRLSLLAEKVHIYGTKLCVQIGPGLGRMVHQDPFTPPYSASAIPSFYYPQLICTPYTKEDIEYLVWSVGYAASLAKTAGADAVELHAYGGYLLDQFHCSLWNKRTDEYGGDLNGRLKFTLDCISAIREQCGPDFPVIVKYTAYHGIPGGTDLAEGILMGQIFEQAGAAALHVDKGCYERWYDQISTVYAPPAHQIKIAAAVKEAVGIPVIAHGKLDDPAVAEEVLQNGEADFIALGHQMLSDPQWTLKVLAGEIADIRPCIGCNECLNMSHKGIEHTCTVNPQALREDDYPVLPAADKKSVLVIGGGPAGMSAALTASKRGHIVELWEKSNSLGGLLLAAGAPDFKRDVMHYAKYLTHMINASNVKVTLNKCADRKSVKAAGFDKVILACGSRPFIPPIEGIDGPNVKEAVAVLRGKESFGRNVVVIGGGLVGCETALHIAETAASVTIVEMLDDILFGADHALNNDQKIRQMIIDSGIKAIPKARVTRITPDKLEYSLGESAGSISCDTVVVASGFRTDHSLEESLEADTDIAVIGDASPPRKIFTAVHEGFHAARIL